MKWLDGLGNLPSATLIGAAGASAMDGLAASGVGIGTGCTLLLIVAYAVIFLAALVPAALDLSGAERRHEVTARPQATSATIGWHAPEWDIENIERESGGGRMAWIEPETDRHRRV